jgi:hypothetical protein
MEEMKASELRIGNLVDIQGDFHRIRSRDIYHIDAGTLKVKPIPLTYTWLSGLGMEKLSSEGGITYYGKKGASGEYDFTIYHDGDSYKHVMTDVDIEHVHTLQNLYFAMKGEEL